MQTFNYPSIIGQIFIEVWLMSIWALDDISWLRLWMKSWLLKKHEKLCVSLEVWPVSIVCKVNHQKLISKLACSYCCIYSQQLKVFWEFLYCFWVFSTVYISFVRLYHNPHVQIAIDTETLSGDLYKCIKG